MNPLSWTIGDVRVTRVLEVEAKLPPEGLFPEATAEALDAHASWLVPHFADEAGQISMAIQGLVIESAGLRILVDTCLGNREVPFEMGEEGSPFLENLASAGFPRESIDIVLCTHLHFDHTGWNTIEQGDRWVPTFPNARYLSRASSTSIGRRRRRSAAARSSRSASRTPCSQSSTQASPTSWRPTTRSTARCGSRRRRATRPGTSRFASPRGASRR